MIEARNRQSQHGNSKLLYIADHSDRESIVVRVQCRTIRPERLPDFALTRPREAPSFFWLASLLDRWKVETVRKRWITSRGMVGIKITPNTLSQIKFSWILACRGRTALMCLPGQENNLHTRTSRFLLSALRDFAHDRRNAMHMGATGYFVKNPGSLDVLEYFRQLVRTDSTGDGAHSSSGV